jgi:hypothetical protein
LENCEKDVIEFKLEGEEAELDTGDKEEHDDTKVSVGESDDCEPESVLESGSGEERREDRKGK